MSQFSAVSEVSALQIWADGPTDTHSNMNQHYYHRKLILPCSWDGKTDLVRPLYASPDPAKNCDRYTYQYSCDLLKIEILGQNCRNIRMRINWDVTFFFIRVWNDQMRCSNSTCQCYTSTKFAYFLAQRHGSAFLRSILASPPSNNFELVHLHISFRPSVTWGVLLRSDNCGPFNQTEKPFSMWRICNIETAFSVRNAHIWSRSIVEEWKRVIIWRFWGLLRVMENNIHQQRAEYTS